MRTPETLTAVERAARLKQQGSSATAGEPVGPPPAAPPGAKNMNAQEKMRQSARDALIKGSANATAGLDPLEEIDGSVTILDIKNIDPYKYNPRTKPNPARAELKASIKAEGITNLITVTRRSPKENYFPYGGGNTRVEIAKELYAEGDQRFSTLTVVTKKWPGDASVITAHLSENDNRGDISFWERAQGVSSFKREFEKDAGRLLTASEINKELKDRGLNYGLKMIQNFAFSTEFLYPIGPWLQTTEVNEVIRPLIGAIQELARKRDAVGQVKAAIDEILLMHGQDLEALELANREVDPADRCDVRVDSESLVTDLQNVAAKALSVQMERVPAIIKAVIENPKASIDELIKVGPENQPKTKATPTNNSQIPLGPMLGSVPRHEKTPAAAEVTTDPNPTDMQDRESRIAAFGRQLTTDFIALNDVVPISDFIKPEPALPFGFLIDFPEASDAIAGHPLSEEQATMREAVWPILAAISGQSNHALVERCGAESAWIQTVGQGQEAVTQRCAQIRVLFRNGVIYVTSVHILVALSDKRVGPALSAVLRTIFDFHKDHPELTKTPFQQLFVN